MADEDYELRDRRPWDPVPEEIPNRIDVSDRRFVPRDGDVVFGKNGVVHRVGDQPRNKRKIVNIKTTEVARMGSKEASIERLRAAMLEFAGIQALLDRFHNQEPPVGTVLRWVKQFDARSGELTVEGVGSVDDLSKALRFNVSQPTEYVFVAFRAPNGKWYTTAQRGASTYDWDALLKEIGDAPCELASDWTTVPAPEKLSEEAMDPTTWARMMFAEKPAAPADEEKTDTPAE